MRITKNTPKTVTIDGDPGDRIGGIDNDGFCIQTITLRWDGRTDLRNKLIAAIRRYNNAPDFGDETAFAKIGREQIISHILDVLPIYRTKRVWVGHNY